MDLSAGGLWLHMMDWVDVPHTDVTVAGTEVYGKLLMRPPRLADVMPLTSRRCATHSRMRRCALGRRQLLGAVRATVGDGLPGGHR